MAIIKDFFIDQGATFTTDLLITDSTNEPFDLTGCDVLSDIKKWPSSETVTATFNCEIGDDPLDGKITLSLTSEDTLNIPARKYYYDVVVLDSTNQVFRVAEGLVIVTPGITKNF